MSEVVLVWLLDADPPSDVGGGKGFYPASANGEPPDATVMRARFAAIHETIVGEAGGRAVVTVHTSPRYRDHFFHEPYLSTWRRLVAAGAALALHPHEDRADGSSLYDDIGHLARVVTGAMKLARAGGLPVAAFRSGGFAFHPDLPALLARAGIGVDLSAAPGLTDAGRCIAWPASSAAPGCLATGDALRPPVIEVPLGWDGRGADLSRNYLFNERMDLEGLRRVFDDVRAAAERDGVPRLVNFLSHGFGLVDPAWRAQAGRFLRHVEARGGRIVGADEARRVFHDRIAPPRLDAAALHA